MFEILLKLWNNITLNCKKMLKIKTNICQQIYIFSGFIYSKSIIL